MTRLEGEGARVCEVGEPDEEREGEESGHALPHVDKVGGVNLQDDHEPDVGEDGESCGDVEDTRVLDEARLSRGDGDDAHGGDHKEIEGGRAHDGTRPELTREEATGGDLDDREQDLRGGGAEGPASICA